MTEEIITKVQDTEASPFIQQKDVILCRSGIQLYSYNEVKACLGEPPVKKAFYREYRPANVVVKAQELCRSLPVTKEHPMSWVNQDNWTSLAGGVLDKDISVVALDGESDGEIGIKSNITFYTRELYDYYMNNKEVSLGYECKKHYVEDADKLGYDIILDEITTVNHLAITKAGRGGSSVAIIDSIIGGLKPMRTGIFAWLKNNKKKDADKSFGETVITSVKDSKEDNTAQLMQCVLDSMSELKDCEAKETLLNVVKDCFDNKEKTIENEIELKNTLDTMYTDIHNNSISEMAEAFSKLGKAEDASEEKKEAEGKAEDTSEEKKEDEDKDKVEDTSEEKREDEDKVEDTSEEKKEDEVENKDAQTFVTKDDILSVVQDTIKPLVAEAVKEVLGIKENNKTEISGIVVDSKEDKEVTRDYSSFLY